MRRGFILKKETILQIFLFLGFFNFISRSTYFVLGACMLFLIFNKNNVIKIDGLFLWLCVWAGGYVLFAHGMAGLGRILLPITAVLCFIVGQMTVKKETMYQDFKKYYFLIALSMMVHGLINLFLNVRIHGWDFGGNRALADLWATEEVLATGQATLFLLLSTILYYLIVFIPKKPTIRYVGLILAVVLGIMYNIMSASRFILFVTIISLIVSVFVHAFHKKTTNKLKPLLIALIAFVIFFIGYQLNLFGVRTWLENSALFKRLDRLDSSSADSAVSSSARKKQIALVLSNLPAYFLGGAPTGLPFVHNTWLSVLNSGGLMLAIPFLLLTVLILVVGVKQILHCPQEHALLVFGYLVGIYAYMYLEPLFEGARLLFLAIAFITGMMSKIESYRKGGNRLISGKEMDR